MALPIGEQAWKTYQDIQSVVVTRYKLFDGDMCCKHRSITTALERLGQAVLLRHDLGDRDLFINVIDSKCLERWREAGRIEKIFLRKEKVMEIPLSTTGEMICANISEWSGGQAYKAVGWDHGRGVPYDEWRVTPETCSWKPSLQDTLKPGYFELKAIANTTASEAWNLFARIQSVVRVELDRLASSTDPGPPEDKMEEINKALARLYQAVRCKYNTLPPDPMDDELLPQVDPSQVDSMDLYTFDTMLDAKCSEWKAFPEPVWCKASVAGYESKRSLRQALNLPRVPFYVSIGIQSPIFGKAASLQNIEENLKLA